MRIPFCLVLAVLCAAPALAQGKSSALAGDARLDKPVTLYWKKATLFEALQEVRQLTGVSLTADRRVVDEPVMASATKTPAREVLDQVARLLHFTWTRNGGTAEKPTYLLIKGVEAAREEEEELSGGKWAVLAELQRQVDLYRRLSRLSPEEASAEQEKADRVLEPLPPGGLALTAQDPRMLISLAHGLTAYSVASPTGRVMMELLGTLSPNQWDRLMQEQPLIFATNPAQGEVELPRGLHDQLRSASPGLPFPRSFFQSLGGQTPEQAEGLTRVEEMMRTEWGRATGYRVTIQVTLDKGAHPMGRLRVSPEPVGETDVSSPLFASSGITLIGAPSLRPEATEDPEARERRLAADPVLGKKATLKLPPLKAAGTARSSAYRVSELLRAVEEAYGVHLVGDAYNRQALFSISPSGIAEQPLYKLLDQMCGELRDWELDGGVVRMKSRTWAFDRRSEIPARYMEQWLAVRTQKGGFSLDERGEIIFMLRDEQVENLIYSAMEAGASDVTDFMAMGTNRDALRFWWSFLPHQRKSLLSGQQLAARFLTPRQQALLVQLGNPHRGGQSFLAAVGPTKRLRLPEQLAQAILSLEAPPISDNQAANRRSGGKGSSVVRTGREPGQYVLRLLFPDGQKDHYALQGPAAAGQSGPVPTAAPAVRIVPTKVSVPRIVPLTAPEPVPPR